MSESETVDIGVELARADYKCMDLCPIRLSGVSRLALKTHEVNLRLHVEERGSQHVCAIFLDVR